MKKSEVAVDEHRATIEGYGLARQLALLHYFSVAKWWRLETAALLFMTAAEHLTALFPDSRVDLFMLPKGHAACRRLLAGMAKGVIEYRVDNDYIQLERESVCKWWEVRRLVSRTPVMSDPGEQHVIDAEALVASVLKVVHQGHSEQECTNSNEMSSRGNVKWLSRAEAVKFAQTEIFEGTKSLTSMAGMIDYEIKQGRIKSTGAGKGRRIDRGSLLEFVLRKRDAALQNDSEDREQARQSGGTRGKGPAAPSSTPNCTKCKKLVDKGFVKYGKVYCATCIEERF